MLLRALIFVVAATMPTSSGSQSGPKAFVCDFSLVATAEFFSGWIAKNSRERLNLTFASIDPDKSRAQMIGNAGATEVLLQYGDKSFSFLEVTAAGNRTLTTIFFGAKHDDAFAAVHSRHMGIGSSAVVSQYRGSCTSRF
jgi:hypothetical protein